MTIAQVTIPEIVLVALVSGIFAFLGALLAQLAVRKRTAAETAKLLAETEKIGAEAEKLRLDIEKQRQELKSDTEKILTKSQETKEEIVAEVERFSKMAEAQLRIRTEEQSLATAAMVNEYRVQTATIQQAQQSALVFLADLKRQFPDWSTEDFKVAAEVLKTLSTVE